MLSGEYRKLYERLEQKISPERMYHDPLHTLAFGTDASFYRMIPRLVVKASDEEEVSFLLQEAAKMEIPVTFRAAGTSLSGQAVTDSVLLIAGEDWKKYQISEDGGTIILQPGLTGGNVNAMLAPYNRKIGPDPASINAAMIGGIAANNASGMCCGTAENTYKTVESIRIVLADGTVLDTGDAVSKEEFLKSHSGLIEEIESLSRSTKNNLPLAEKIRNKFKMKNTTGYSLNALVDFVDPFRIIEHLMVGSEGTLGFISQIKLRTVPERPFRASSLMIFPDIENACNAVSVLKSEPVAAVELIDRSGLQSVENENGMPDYLKALPQEACALLVETVSDRKEDLHNQIHSIFNSVTEFPFLVPLKFTDIPEEYTLLWNIRKGLFPSVGAMRRKGTSVIIEDVAFPVPRLAEATIDLQKILKRYGYHDAVIFGHALEGNLHFVFSQDFGIKEEITRYEKLMSDIVELVVGKYNGSLKAEHGTGRNIAPFVEREWGKEAYNLMTKIKQIFDPQNILNPGVILNPDPSIHLKNLKPVPAADEIVDKCTDCGFCESSCVSSGLTLTPRQRIVAFREISRLKSTGAEPHILASLLRSFSYSGNQTCATDGLCAVSCPVKIDTGKLIKHLRSEKSEPVKKRAGWISRNMKLMTASARTGLNVVGFFHSVLGATTMRVISSWLRKISRNRIPKWNQFIPAGAKKIKIINDAGKENLKKVVYFPSCINRSMGVSKDHRKEPQLTDKMLHLLDKAGYDVIFPENLNELCCGMAFLSKGFTEAGLKKSAELEAALLKASNNGEYPVLCDMSPCLFTMKENMGPALKLCEPVEFILNYLLPYLIIEPLDEEVTVFPVCSMKKMGLDNKLAELARLCARKVIVPEANCCGFAGDRGFSFPELTSHGLRNLKEQIPGNVRNGYSTSRTCEIGLSLHSGIPYKSIVYLVDQASRSGLVT